MFVSRMQYTQTRCLFVECWFWQP